MPLMIRPARLDQASEVLALWQAAEAHPTVTDTLAAVQRLIHEHPGSLVVAELDGRIVGTIIVGWDGWRGTLYRLAVHPEVRRRGIARALVVAALERCRERGIERVSAFVVRDDRQAVAFWSSLADLGIGLDPAPKVRFVTTVGRDPGDERDVSPPDTPEAFRTAT